MARNFKKQKLLSNVYVRNGRVFIKENGFEVLKLLISKEYLLKLLEQHQSMAVDYSKFN